MLENVDGFDDSEGVKGTDQNILSALGGRLARQRLSRNLTQATLAREAGVSKRTVERMEAGESVQLNNALRVLRVLELLGGLDRLVPEVPASPMAALEAERGRRKRARDRTVGNVGIARDGGQGRARADKSGKGLVGEKTGGDAGNGEASGKDGGSRRVRETPAEAWTWGEDT